VLHARLAGSPGAAVVALVGLGGIGKTTVALEYAHRHVGEYAVMWQFHAEDGTGMLSQFHDLARVLDIDDGGDPVAAVHTALAGHAGRWLLVLDNVTDHVGVRRWIPPKGDGHVLVTTRDVHWPAQQVLRVEALEAHTGATFLMDGTGSTDVVSARAVSAELGGLPLALAQAAAYCQATGRTLADYWRLLRDNHVTMLARGAPAAHAAPVVATWSLAMERLEVVSPGAVTKLRITAHLGPDDIPFRLLVRPRVKLPKAGVDRRIVRQVRALCSGDVAVDDAVAAAGAQPDRPGWRYVQRPSAGAGRHTPPTVL